MISIEEINPKLVQVFSIEQHSQMRDKILSIYDQMLKAHENRVDNYYSEYRVPYRQIIFDYLKPSLLEYANSWHYSDAVLKFMWFVQYEDNDQQGQGWHGHDYTSVSAIYLLELPDPKYATQFHNLKTDNLKEGDLIVFPSVIPHRCPDVIGGRKTAIGLDFNLKGCTL